MAYLFTSPTQPDSPRPRDNRLMRHVAQPPRGRHVVRIGGTWRTMDTLTTSVEATADLVLYGGHETVVTDAQAAELVSAGYGDNLEEI